MSLILLEELEVILNETSQVKHTLNAICGTVWNLLNPPGANNNNELKAHKVKESNSPNVIGFEGTYTPNSLEESLESVSKLIALGKLVRGATKNEKESGNSASEVCSKPLQTKNNLGKVTKLHEPPMNSSSKHLVPQGGNDRSLKKNVGMKINSQFDKDCTRRNPTPEQGRGEQNVSCTYSHTCSLTLPNIVKTIKVPEDLRGLLKQYFNYEKHNENLNSLEKGPTSDLQTFFQRFYNVTRLKLESDLKANIKQTERYMKYLDISQEITQKKSKSNKRENYYSVAYTVISDLTKYEEKSQQLMELKIKMRLLNIFSDQLSTSSV